MPSMNDGKSCHAEPAVPAADAPLDLTEVRARLAGLEGRHYWRGLEELAGTARFREFLHREFPRQASEWTDAVSRRDFLQLMGASLALAGLSACTRNPVERIVPYVKAPEFQIPGNAVYYATSMNHGGSAIGVLVESQMGRPIKIEGNDLHPASLGKTDAITQASILSLYDPDRSQVLVNTGDVRPWGSFLTAMREAMAGQKASGGRGFRILTQTVTSPTQADQIKALLAAYPAARWYQYEPVNRDNAYEGARLAFGQVVDTQYRFDRADVVVSLDADFLKDGPESVRHVRDFAAARRARPDTDHGESTPRNRLYAIESTMSLTGARADHRLAIAPHEIEDFARSLLRGVRGAGGAGGAHGDRVGPIARDLLAHRGRSIVIAGPGQPAIVHALAHHLNAALGNTGNGVIHTAPVAAKASLQREEIAALVGEMNAGQVGLLVIAGGNPAYDAPVELDFARALDKVAIRVHHGVYQNETSDLCHWHVPETHYLEAWGDARAFDGTVSLQQPLIAPLYEGRSAHELLSVFGEQQDRSGYDTVRDYWKRRRGGVDFEAFWRKALHDGVVEGTAEPPLTLPEPADSALETVSPPPKAGLDIAIRPDPHLHDGRYAGNAWLQELPRPVSRITWDNAIWISPVLAEREALVNGDVAELSAGATRVAGPVWIVPGLPAGTVTVHLGYGRSRAGRVATGVGFHAGPFLPATGGWFVNGAALKKTGKRMDLATVQEHGTMEGRHLVRSASTLENERNPHWVHELAEDPPADLTMYKPYPYDGYKWGMTIDLSACVGCDACTIACQAENNIPVVGKKQVLKGREMHWIRVDRYFEGNMDSPAVHHQPVPCMHCENAPCEVVCPVGATVHDAEGLNEMVYNRCVGTRYCSNNCPYKVRRFNFLQFSDQKTPSLKLLANPDVTVRTRGVMEKCTYCIQRISEARITSEKEDRRIRDGEVTPACAQACPATAIVFGDLNDAGSRVAGLKRNPLNYGILTELNTHPRTTYLADVRNLNPEIAALEGRPGAPASNGGHEG